MACAMSDTLPLIRQWTMLRTLAARKQGLGVRELAHEMDVSEKTIRRDLQLLARLGFPLEESAGDHGRKSWRMNGDGLLELRFTFDELAALYLGRRLLEPLAGTVVWDAAQRAFQKIRSGLSERSLNYLAKLAATFHGTTVGASDYAQRGDIIDRLMMAAEERKIAFITYRSLRSTEAVTYDVYPYGVIYHRGSLYLVAFAPAHGELRHYKVDRIDDVDVQPLQFVRPTDFNLQSHLANAFGVFVRNGRETKVRVRFDPSVARYVEEKHWHPSQKLTQEPDGSLLAEFTLSALEEVTSWILGFGANAVVLEPELLRGEIFNSLKQSVRRYEAKTKRRNARRKTSRKRIR